VVATHTPRGPAASTPWKTQRGCGVGSRRGWLGLESSRRSGWAASLAGGRALSWLSCYRRLQVRWDRDAGRFFAFVLLACALVCFKRL
jgi:hypothetical protein